MVRRLPWKRRESGHPEVRRGLARCRFRGIVPRHGRRLEPRSGRGSEVEMLSCARVRITAPHPVPTQVDGDVFGVTPVEIDAGSREVRLIVPEHQRVAKGRE